MITNFKNSSGRSKVIKLITLIGSVFLFKNLVAGITIANISVPHSFTSGQAISSSQVNANFNALVVGINTIKDTLVTSINSIQGALTIAQSDIAVISAKLAPPTPQGRLSLSSTDPLGTASTTQSIYYHPYSGNRVPIYDGSDFVGIEIPASPVAFSITNTLISNIYDLFAFSDNGTWRAIGASANNSIQYIDGLAESPVQTTLNDSVSVSGGGRGFLGVNRDVTNTSAGGQAANSSASTSEVPVTVTWTFPPAIGYHQIYCLEFLAAAGSLSQNVAGTMMLTAELDM